MPSARAHILIPWLILLLSPALRTDEADERYQFIAGLYDKGLFDVAAREGEKFLVEFPRHPKADLARYRLASALFELDRSDEAAPHFRLLAQSSAFEYASEAWLRLGQCELEAGHLTAAKEALARARASSEEYLHAPAAFLLGEAAFRAGEHEAARASYADALELAPGGEYSLHAQRGLAWCEHRLGEDEAAAARAQAFLRDHGQHELASEVRFLLGEALLSAGRPREALAAWEGVKEGPFLDAALRGRGFALSALDDDEGAARAFGELLERFPGGRFEGEAALQHGAHLVRAGDAAQATEALASPAAGAGPETLFWLGQAQALGGDREGALRTYERALRARPAQELAARLRTARADLLFDLGRLDEAVGEYERASGDYALQAGAAAHLNAGRPAEAVRMASALLHDHPESPYRFGALLALGEGHFALEHYAQAQQAFAVVAEAEDEVPAADRARALSRVAWCRYLQGEPREAAELFARVTERHPRAPEAPEARYMEGRARAEGGDEEAAALVFRRYLSEHARGAQREDVLLRLARIEGGAARLETLLSESPQSELADRALSELAQVHELAGERAAAIRRYRELLERFPHSARAHSARYGLAWCLQQEGEHAAATDELALLLETLESERDAELRLAALELLLWAARDAGRLDLALGTWEPFRAACRDEPRRFAAAQALARALKDADRHDQAQGLLLGLLEGARERAVAIAILVERAWIELDRAAPAEAEKQVKVALRLCADDETADDSALAEAAFFVGEAHFAAGAHQSAIGLYAAAASARRSTLVAEASYKEGFSRLVSDDAEGALSCFRRVVAEQRESDMWGESAFLLGESCFRLGRWQEAAEVLELLRAEKPRHEILPKALFRLGLALVELGEWKRAEAALTELVKKNPEFEQKAEAELGRGRALAELGDARGARSAFERVLAGDKGVLAARARLELGRLHLAAEQIDEALSEFLKVSLLFAHEAEVAEGLFYAGRCLEAQNEPELARRQYDELVSKHPKSPYADAARERLGALARG